MKHHDEIEARHVALDAQQAAENARRADLGDDPDGDMDGADYPPFGSAPVTPAPPYRGPFGDQYNEPDSPSDAGPDVDEATVDEALERVEASRAVAQAWIDLEPGQRGDLIELDLYVQLDRLAAAYGLGGDEDEDADEQMPAGGV